MTGMLSSLKHMMQTWNHILSEISSNLDINNNSRLEVGDGDIEKHEKVFLKQTGSCKNKVFSQLMFLINKQNVPRGSERE